MKRNRLLIQRLAAVLAVLLVLSCLFAGCDNSQTPSPSTQGSTPPPSTQATQAPTQPPATEPTETEPAEDANWLDTIYDPAAGEGKFSIYFINATKDYVTDSSVTHAGDSTILVSPEGKTMLIDINNAANGSEIVASLQRLGIDTLDYLVLSHPHADHIGSYAVLLRYINVKEVIKNEHDYTTSSSVYGGMMSAFEERNIPITYVHDGDTFMFGSVEVHVMNPVADYVYDDATATANNGSVLLRFVYGDSSYLTGGDLYAAQELKLVEKFGDALKTDVVKINHHGYDTSSTKEWVNAVSCKIACCEANGVNSDVVEGRYRLSGAQTLYTCLDGTIVVRTTGDGTYQVQVEYERFIPDYGILTDLPGYHDGAFEIS